MIVDTWPERREGFDAFPCVVRCCRRIYPGEASVSECLEDEKRRLHHDEGVKAIIAPSNPQLSAYVQSPALHKRPGAVVPPFVASDQGTGRPWYVPSVCVAEGCPACSKVIQRETLQPTADWRSIFAYSASQDSPGSSPSKSKVRFVPCQSTRNSQFA